MSKGIIGDLWPNQVKKIYINCLVRWRTFQTEILNDEEHMSSSPEKTLENSVFESPK